MAKRNGRPPHQPTTDLRMRVSIAAGGGMPHEEIALTIGVSTPTLRKHYAAELSTEAAKRRMENFASLFASAQGGNVSAQKAYAAARMAPAAPDPEPDPVPAGLPAGTPAGKKAQAAADAKVAQVGTDWEDLLTRPGAPGVQ